MTLNLNAKHLRYGHSVAEHIATVSDELPVDAVGVWQLVPAGRYGFGLTGDDLTEFVRRCIVALLESGAKPVIGGADVGCYWIEQPQYGETSDEIADAVIAQWLAEGAQDRDPGWLWFALPTMIGTKIK